MSDKTIIADEVVSRSIATVQDAVAGFDKFQAGIAAIAAAHPVDVACDLTTTAGTKAATAGRAAWRDPRIALEKARKAAKAPVLELGKAIDAFAGRIESQLLIGENNYDGQIKAHEAAVKEAAIARARAEAERIARHEAGLNTIRLYVQKANGLESAKLRLGIEALAAQRYGAEWEEFAAKAVIAQTETLETLQSMLNIAVAREEEAAERERQRAENARVAAELAAERAALAAQKAKDEAAAAELRAAEDAKRAAELAAQRAEQARIAAEQKAAQDALDAQAAELKRQSDAIAAHNAAMAEAERVKREAEERADILSRIGNVDDIQKQAGDSMPQILDAPPGARERFEAMEKEEEPTLKLGDMNALLGTGITMSESFVCQTLGVPKADVPGRAVLFKPSQRNVILEALAEHCLKIRG